MTSETIKVKEKSSEGWLAYGDWVRVIGTLAVVLTHCMDFILGNQTVYDQNRSGWWVANLIDASTRWAVPVYIMLSGAILLAPTRNETTATFYRKRLARVGLPLLIWVPFFILFALYVTHWQKAPELIDQLLHGEPYGHLHFVVRILGLYAITPMLRVFTANATRPMLLWTVILILSLGALNSTIDAFTGARSSAAIRFVPFIGFYFAGYYLRDVHLSTKNRWLTIFAFIGSTAMIVVVTGLLVPKYGLVWYPSISFICYDFLSVPRIILGLSAWLLLTDICRHMKKPKWLPTLAGATFGIYIIHPFFKDLAVLNDIWKPESGLWKLNFGTWPSFFIFYAGVYFASAITIILILKLPYLRRIFG